MVVELDIPKLGLAEAVRKVCPQTLIVEPRYPEAKPEKRFQQGYQFDAVEEFRRYYLQHEGTTVPPSVLEAFEQLHQELSDAIA